MSLAPRPVLPCSKDTSYLWEPKAVGESHLPPPTQLLQDDNSLPTEVSRTRLLQGSRKCLPVKQPQKNQQHLRENYQDTVIWAKATRLF